MLKQVFLVHFEHVWTVFSPFQLCPSHIPKSRMVETPRVGERGVDWRIYIFLCLPRAEQNPRFLFVKNESIKFCCAAGFSNVPNVVEASVLFISIHFHRFPCEKRIVPLPLPWLSCSVCRACYTCYVF